MVNSSANFLSLNFDANYADSTKETLIGLYSKRDENGQPIETVTDIVNRVALSNAIAELKYKRTPEELFNLTLKGALECSEVKSWAEKVSFCIGNQYFWANTPGNINADPEVALDVLRFQACGEILGMSSKDLWSSVDNLLKEQSNNDPPSIFKAREEMVRIVHRIKGKGCLAACGVAFVEDTLESIQDTAKIEALAAKSAMGMGLNTSNLRPWASIVSNGAASSGPDRFYEKTISMAVAAVAQGGRRGGALIELRNSNHPDILFFLNKKKLVNKPDLQKLIKQLGSVEKAEQEFTKQIIAFNDKQNYLKNTNITVLAMPGFMDAVRNRDFYRAKFQDKDWNGNLYDPERPLFDEKGNPKINKLTKEFIYDEYAVDLRQYPHAVSALDNLDKPDYEIRGHFLYIKGHFYAPDVFNRIIVNMQNSGEPGIMFYDTVNKANANNHVYDLNTCNPCGEQNLPAGLSKDGKNYLMGTCNLSSLHAAHKDFWNLDGSYNYEKMEEIAEIMQRFMDNVTDISWYPISHQNWTARAERRNGGGFAGIAELLSRLGVEFGSKAGLYYTKEVYRRFNEASLRASLKLAEERGVYHLWQGSTWQKKGLKVRNTCMTNNAPTGTLAQALQTTWGVDPHNGIVFSRKVRSRYVDFVAPGFQTLMEKYNAWPSDEFGQQALMKKIRDNGKSCRGLDCVPREVQKAFPVRVEVEPEDYIRHLAAIHDSAEEFPEVFNSVSNTCSIPINYDLTTIHDAVMLSYDLGVKSITFYPDGSRLSQPVEQIAEKILPCSVCGGSKWLKVDGCYTCEQCGCSKCG